MIMIQTASLPQVFQGVGALAELPDWLAGRKYTAVALCTGTRSFASSSLPGCTGGEELIKSLHARGITTTRYIVSGEPSPEVVDQISEKIAGAPVECVIGIGGGSAIDTAKAVSAMAAVLRNASGEWYSVREFLEGVGTRSPQPERIGLVAVPTTSGTGSEATKNAVISSIGAGGFKKSLRHDAYVPDLAILDPCLTAGASREVTAAAGLDAVTQLLESYVSTESTIFTDALAAEGLKLAGKSFSAVCGNGTDLAARSDMAYAAYLSGVTLANANLGVIHGAAATLGGERAIPHGIACGTLLAEATQTVVEKLVKDTKYTHPAVVKYSNAGYYLNLDKEYKDVKFGVTLLLDRLFRWQDEERMPLLRTYGFSQDELLRLAGKTGLKKTPVTLTADDIRRIFTARQ